MQVINWLELRLQESDIQPLRQSVIKAIPARKLRQMLVAVILRAYPWDGREDLIPFYHPSQNYRVGAYVALPRPDPQGLRPMAWHVARVVQAKRANNPIQGAFQALTLDVYGKKIHVAAAIPGAQFISPTLSDYSLEDLAWLSAWIADAFEKPLQTALEKLIVSEQLSGKFIGETFLPHYLAALEPSQLARFFETLSLAQPWISAQEILSALPELSDFTLETSITLLRDALTRDPYRFLGGDRWTTSELYDQLNREIPRGLPVPHVRSKLNIWTEQDKQIFAQFENKSLPIAVLRALDEYSGDNAVPETDLGTWNAPTGPIRLPTLNYLHVTQSYFPVEHIIHVFHPDVRLVFVQFISGEHQPFLLDRDSGLLKALVPETLRTLILDAGIPAGTHLWMEYQGGENYRIAPRPLSVECNVPCKLAYIENGELHIEHTEIPMQYEGDPSVFKAELRFSDIEALFAEARHSHLSVLDAITYTVKELCATDPLNHAHRLDIFNAVFLKRMCSPNSVSVLLYTQPCFMQLGNGYFRYAPPSVEAVVKHQPRPREKWRAPDLVDHFSKQIKRAPVPIIDERKVAEPDLQAALIEIAPNTDQNAVLTKVLEGIAQKTEIVQYEPVIRPALPVQPTVNAEPHEPAESVTNLVPDEQVAKTVTFSTPDIVDPRGGLEAADIPKPDHVPTDHPIPESTTSESVPVIEPVLDEKAGNENTMRRETISPLRRIWLQVRHNLTTLWGSFWRKYVR